MDKALLTTVITTGFDWVDKTYGTKSVFAHYAIQTVKTLILANLDSLLAHLKADPTTGGPLQAILKD